MNAKSKLTEYSTLRKVVLMFNILNAAQVVGLIIFTGIVFSHQNTRLGIGLLFLLVVALPSLACGFYCTIVNHFLIVYIFLCLLAIQGGFSLVWAIIGPSEVLRSATAFDGAFLLVVVWYWWAELAGPFYAKRRECLQP